MLNEEQEVERKTHTHSEAEFLKELLNHCKIHSELESLPIVSQLLLLPDMESESRRARRQHRIQSPHFKHKKRETREVK